MSTPVTIFKTDPDLEKSGIWLDFGDGLKIKVRRSGGRNAAFEQHVQGSLKRYRFQVQQGTLDPELDKGLTLDAYIATVVVDWTWRDENGDDLPFTADNVRELFGADPDLYAEVRRQADSISNFRVEAQQADEKNSPNGSSGKTNGAAGRKR